MSFFPFLHFFDSLAYLYLAVFILLKNPKALVNRLMAAVVTAMMVWSFTMIFVHNPLVSKKTATFAAHINAFGWCTFSSFMLWFVLAYTGKTAILKKKWLYLVLFLPSLFFLYKQWTGYILVDYTMHFYGWKAVWSTSIWPHLYSAYYLSYITISLNLILKYKKKAVNPVKKKQASVMFYSLLAVIIMGTMTDMVLPLSGIDDVPNLANTIALLWAVAVVYAMTRYRFLTVTPEIAAENIISTMYDCLILLDTGGMIITVNNATLNLTGYMIEQIRGKPLEFLLSEGGNAGDVFEEIARDGNVKNKDLIIKCSEGKEIPVLLSSSVLLNEHGAPAGIVCVARDISERIKLQEETFKSKKLESIGFLAGGIAHDFNNLLSIILGNLQLLKDKMPKSDQLSHRMLEHAEEATLKATELAHKFITLSPGGLMEREPIPMLQILEEVTSSNLTADPKTHLFWDIQLGHGLPPVLGEEKQLEQVFRAILHNAVEAVETKHGRRNGRIDIHAQYIYVQHNLDSSNKETLVLREGHYVKVLIRDNGGGIPPQFLNKVFEPYFSTKGEVSRKGMGLGLSLCYSIIKKHDGHIDVQSREGQGTTVTVYLPSLPFT